MVVGISSSGKAPSFSAYLRRYLDKLLPSSLGSKLNSICLFREGQKGKIDREEKIKAYTKKVLKSEFPE